jgi:hypothetical protein
VEPESNGASRLAFLNRVQEIIQRRVLEANYLRVLHMEPATHDADAATARGELLGDAD